jgi:hypothetical protein
LRRQQPVVPSQSHLHRTPAHSDALLGPIYPYRDYRLPLSSQPVTSTPSWQTPTHSNMPLRSLSQPHPLHHPSTYDPPRFSTPISNPAADLQLRTPSPFSHHWNSTSTPVPRDRNASRCHPQIFGVSAPQSPFRLFPAQAVVASSSGGPHTATYQRRNLTFDPELPTPRELVNPPPTPFSLPQYHQQLPSGHVPPAPPHLGLFTPFPSPHPMAPTGEHHNSQNFSFH